MRLATLQGLSLPYGASTSLLVKLECLVNRHDQILLQKLPKCVLQQKNNIQFAKMTVTVFFVIVSPFKTKVHATKIITFKSLF